MIDKFDPDLVHSYLWLSDVVTATANRKEERPHIAHIVDRRPWQTSQKWKHRFRRWLTRRALKNSATRFIAVSNAAAQFAIENLELSAEKVYVAANSIDTEDFLKIEDSPAWAPAADHKPLILGIAGRLEAEKGHKYLLEAVAALRNKNLPVRLLVTGEGSIRKELESTTQRLGIAQQVEFLGWLSDVCEFWRRIDVFVVPSISSEGLPTTILEAMASGRVVVASDIGGAVEAIRDRVDGLIVPPRDVEALANALERIFRDRENVIGMCRSARQRVQQHFSTPMMMQTIMKCYQFMLTRKQSN